jgi:hypothetical protein
VWPFDRKKAEVQGTATSEKEKPRTFSITVLSWVERNEKRRHPFLNDSYMRDEEQTVKKFIAAFVEQYRGAPGYTIGAIETMSLQEAVELFQRNGSALEDPRELFPEHYARTA